jgi:TRAP transporter TAXI family solute receptor
MKKRTAWWIFGLALLGLGLAILAFGKYVRPAPPKRVVISTGAEGGAYFRYAKAYVPAFNAVGVKVDIRTSAGSVENAARLADETSDVDFAFIQSGIGDSKLEKGLVSLGAIAYEPLWIFLNSPAGGFHAGRISDLSGMRIGVGPPGSGSRKVALELLKDSGVTEQMARLVEEPIAESVRKLKTGGLDALVFIAALDTPFIQDLFQTPNVTVMSLELADAYARRLPALSRFVIPQGVVDPVHKVPAQDVITLAATANLVAKDETHPALMYLMLKTAQEIHMKPTLASRTAEFPSLVFAQDYEISDEAKRYHKEGEPFLYKYLPFGLANFLSRFLVILVPALALLLPLTDWIPKVQSFSLKRKFFKHYDEIRAVDLSVANLSTPDALAAAHADLNAIEARINAIKAPTMYSSMPYDLRDHIDLVRVRLDRRAEALKVSAVS